MKTMKMKTKMTTILCPLNTVILEGGAEDEEAPEEPVLDDDLRRVIVDVHIEAETAKEKEKLEHMLEDHKKSCTQIVKMATQSSVPH